MDKEKLAKAMVKAIAYAENGGSPDIDNLKAGKTGEAKSLFQFVPETWKLYSKEVFGKEMPLNPDNETYVVNEKVKKWIDAGYNSRQIASMWNAGESKPNAYKENWKGVNKKYGVSYDTPAYAEKVTKYAEQFASEKEPKQMIMGNSTVQTKPLKTVLSLMKQAQIPKEEANKGGILPSLLQKPQGTV